MSALLKSIQSAFNKDADAAQAVTKIAKKVVFTAYAKNDTLGVQLMLDAMTRNYRDALPRFFRRAGFTIDVQPGKPAIVGLLDKSNQAKVFEWLGKDTTMVVNPEDVFKYKTKAAPSGTYAEQAAKAVEGFIKREKKAHPEVGAIINQMIQRPAWFAKFASLELTDAEVEFMLEEVTYLRVGAKLKAA
jgi:hypothetical protein